ncbi:putative polysaccharide biosynthesis protein [Jeotgalibaca ciconiae]|uniref:Polysaccharide biosynthesis protein n=1 Tax=Jeotgalibaca ciconiae TaxID=2496265 RepID=A0A3Q9BMB6_9LACT|nr:polysaccharide biosynthesis protein [Jeotgalibaca ciconiae]AZP05536.1 polysaccharide biosynthesis protein [Jeotgalibaca ciconiae]HJB22617.1 polysaccharide biosynthesis protein [Candidatus Jeotgalibaca pullicola]
MQKYKTRAERKRAEKQNQLKQDKFEIEDLEEITTVPSEDSPEEESVMENLGDSEDKMVEGTFWMTFGSIFSRLLGALYIIPWNAMMGASSQIGNALFSIGYTPYQFFLSVGTAGFPSAMSKQIAEYNAKKQYKAGQELFKKSLIFMLFTGVASSLLMFLLAPVIAHYSPGASVADKTLVIRSLAPALLVVPVMSLIRGYFQGYQNMIPSAITNIVEQVVRVAYMLLATYVVMQVIDGRIATAVAHSTFAAFVGAFASLLMLMWYYQKHIRKYGSALKNDTIEVSIDITSAIKKLVAESIPFIIVGSGITFGKFIDQFTFEPIMLHLTEFDKDLIGELYSLFSFNADKLIMIIISLAVGMSATSIPLLVENYIKQDFKQLGKQIKQVFELFFFVMFPSAFGMMIVSKPIYSLFYGITDFNPLGAKLLAIASVMSIILGAFTIAVSILQSFGDHRSAIIYLGIGLLVKIATQYPFIYLFETSGALYATSVGFLVTTILSVWKIQQLVRFDINSTLNSIGVIALITGWMIAIAHIVLRVAGIFLSSERRFTALLLVFVVAIAGGTVYLYLALKTRIADRVLGDRVSGLRKKLKIS